jgi:hypothetical protein
MLSMICSYITSIRNCSVSSYFLFLFFSFVLIKNHPSVLAYLTYTSKKGLAIARTQQQNLDIGYFAKLSEQLSSKS